MMHNATHENGLKEKHQQQIIAILRANPNVQSAWIFGSRAMGTYKPNSDIDIVLEGEKLGLSDIANLLAQIESTTIPYKVDLLVKHRIENKNLLAHIDNYGVRWF